MPWCQLVTKHIVPQLVGYSLLVGGYFLNPTDLFGVASETINCTDTSSTICEKENCMHNNEPRLV